MKHPNSIVLLLALALLFVTCKNDKKESDKENTNLENHHQHQVGETGHDVANYQCPMKCEGEKTYNEAGSCPTCKMQLKQISSDDHGHHDSKAKAVYQCPMKCEGELTYPEKGSCPKCKMDLKELK